MHLTDDQLNEYLDNESAERAQIEIHLSSCDECAARLTALQTLFAEIESLPKLELSHSIAARFTPTPSLPPQLPRWLTLTATLQAALALIAAIIAAPFITKLLPSLQIPSLTDGLLQLQTQWPMWLNQLSTLRLNSWPAFQLPTLPQLPTLEIPSMLIALTLVGVSMLWLVGNGLLLRNQQ
jgi:anti-sigma factor RsiW